MLSRRRFLAAALMTVIDIPGQSVTVPPDPAIAAETARAEAAEAALSARIAKLEGGTPPVTPPSSGIYGPGIGFDGLANTTLWAGSQVQYMRFRASQSSQITTCRIYRLAKVPDPGYTLGNGGTWTAAIHADNGSGKPVPAPLSQVSFAASAVDNAGFVITFPSPAAVMVGSLNHLVISNTDNVAVNYWAPDGIFNPHSSPQQPRYPDTDWAWGYASSINGPWTEREEQVQTLNIGYANGAFDGQGYMELSYGSDAGTISGAAQVRERFLTSAAHTVSQGGAYLHRVSGTDPLILTLEGSSGTIEAVSVPAASVPIDASLSGPGSRSPLPTRTRSTAPTPSAGPALPRAHTSSIRSAKA